MAAVVAAIMTADQRTEHMTKMVETSRQKLQAEIKKDEDRRKWPYVRRSLYETIRSHRFELACGAVILINMFLVIIETDAAVEDGEAPGWVGAFTLLLLGVYTTELGVKLYVYRTDFFKDMWNVIDFVVVGVDLVFLCMGVIIDMPSISILRIFRLVKLARAFKAAKSFRELKSLLRACSCALKAIFWGMLLLVMALTVWGILAVQLIHPINQDIATHKPWLYAGCERCPRAYATVFASMLTFWKQLVAGDSWGTLCEPIIEEAKWTSIFFMLVLVTVNLTMLNCILAVVVEAGAAAAAADEHDKALEREKMVVGAEGRLIDLCHGLDSDASGSLTIEEFQEGFHSNREFKECLELMHVTQADMSMIFNICDEDDSGDVDYREFVEQLRRIKHSSEQIILNYVTDIRHMVNKLRPEVLKPRYTGQPSTSHCTDLDAFEQKDQAAGDQDLLQGKGENEYQLVSATEALQEMPPELSSILENSDQPMCQNMATFKADTRPNQIEEKYTDQDQAGTIDTLTPTGQSSHQGAVGYPLYSESNIDDSIPQEKWKRIWQANEDLVTIMKEHSVQAKVQTELLTQLLTSASSLANVSSSITPTGGSPPPPQPQAMIPAAASAGAVCQVFDAGAVGHMTESARGSMTESARSRLATESSCCATRPVYR